MLKSATITFLGAIQPVLSFNSLAVTSTGSPFTYSTPTAGTYQFEITDANGCTDQVGNINVFGPFAQAPVVSYDLFNSTGCPGNGSATILSVQSLAGDPIPGNPGSLVYQWSTGATDVTSINNIFCKNVL